MTDAEKLARIRKWAESLVNCSHIPDSNRIYCIMACSMAEGTYKEIHGQEALDILDGKMEVSVETESEGNQENV